METIKEEEEEIEQKNLGIKKWTEEDNDKIGNMVDPYNKLWRNPRDEEPWEEGWCYDLAKWLSHYLFSFPFSFILIRKSMDMREDDSKETRGTL